jgi:hypothetical protein
MGTNKQTKKPANPQRALAGKQVKKKNNYRSLIFIAIVLIGAAAAGVFFLGGNNKSSNEGKSGTAGTSPAVKTTPANITAGIEIKKEEITEKAKFYPYEVDGIKMEVLAIKAKDGSIRVAFNTCQVCYSSGKGYYIQQGDELVCQNCGNRFKADQVGIVKGGCNPVPIAESGRADDGKIIKIDKSYLSKNKAYFSNWKA